MGSQRLVALVGAVTIAIAGCGSQRGAGAGSRAAWWVRGGRGARRNSDDRR